MHFISWLLRSKLKRIWTLVSLGLRDDYVHNNLVFGRRLLKATSHFLVQLCTTNTISQTTLSSVLKTLQLNGFAHNL